MTTLVTGASGFIGKRVLSELAGHSLRLLVLPDDPVRDELEEYGEVIAGDITRGDTLRPALEGVNRVIHMAGYVHGGRGPESEFMRINAGGTANLAQAARSAGVSRFIYTSSITVYGHAEQAVETDDLIATPGYPVSKIQAERAIRSYLPRELTLLRFPLVIGPGDTGFLCPALRQMQQAGRVPVIGSGEEPWSILTVDDAARAVAFVLGNPKTRGQTLNVTSDTITNGALLRAFAEHLEEATISRIPGWIAKLRGWLSEVFNRQHPDRQQIEAFSQPLAVSDARIRSLGFSPDCQWREALSEGVTWCFRRWNAG